MKRKMAFVDLTNFHDWPMGGMLEYERAILNHLTEEYDVDLWGVSLDGKLYDNLIINGKEYPIHVYADAKTKGKIIPNYYRGLKLSSVKKSFPKDYDIVYAHTGSCIVAVQKMIDRNKTKLVYHQHGLNHLKDYSLMSLIQRPFLKRAQIISDLVLVVSDYISVDAFAKKMQGMSSAKFVSVGSPINLARFNYDEIKDKIIEKKDTKTQNFLYTGRLSKFKDVKTLIEAMKLYVDNINKEAKLVVAGSGPEFDNLKKQIQQEKLENNVLLLGAISHDEVYKYLQNSDVFLTASGGEGVSVSVLEAYASGLPVVCFKVPGLEGQIKDGVTGVFAKDRTSRDFYEAMIEVDKMRTEYSLNCLKEAQKYDSKIISQKIIDEIEGLFKDE